MIKSVAGLARQITAQVRSVYSGRLKTKKATGDLRSGGEWESIGRAGSGTLSILCRPGARRREIILELASERLRGFAREITALLPSLLIITPTLGDSPWLEGAVEGVAALQSACRHVLVAPGAVVPALKVRFPQVSVLPESAPGCGVYSAINAGADAIPEWDWLTWINDDDRLLPGFEEIWRRAQAAQSSTDVWYGEVDYIDSEGRKLSAMPVCRRPADVPALLAAGLAPLTQQGALISRELWRRAGGVDNAFRVAGDFDFWVRAAARGARFQFVPQTVAAFRVRPGQLSGDVMQAKNEVDAVLRRGDLRVVRLNRWLAAIRFRLQNLSHILARARRTGRLSSRGMFAG